MKKIFLGLFFIMAGIFIFVDQMGHYTDIGLFSLLCTILLIPIFVRSLLKMNFVGILFSAAFLCILYRGPLNLESITPTSILLVALLGSIGLSIMFNKHNFCGMYHFERNRFRGCHHEHFSEVVNGVDDDEVNFSVNCGSSIKYINSEDFKTANLKCYLGAMKVYFDNAKIKGDSAIINVDASLSGVELYIPKGWEIINKVDVTLGAVEPKNNNQTKPEKTVTLIGKISLGAIEIIYI